MDEARAYATLLAGSTVARVVGDLGYRLGGRIGSALATVAVVLPSAVAMLLLAAPCPDGTG